MISYLSDDGGAVLVQVEQLPQQGGYEQVSVGTDVVAKAKASLQEVVDVLRPLSDTLTDAVERMVKRPDSLEVSFGIKLGVSAGVIVSKGSAEANLDVKMIWDGSRARAAGDAG
jgi:hypothetical protein